MSTAAFKTNLTIVGNPSVNYGYQPLKTGNIAPTFSLPTADGITAYSASGSLSRELYIMLQDFLDNQLPLVIAFVGASKDRLPDFKLLENLQSAIQSNGGKLLVLTNIEARLLRKKISNQNSLCVFYDKDNAIAELFGVYDYENPLWKWVSGVEAESESLPALYTIAPDRQILFSHIDYNFSFFHQYSYHSRQVIGNLLQQVQKVARQYQYSEPQRYKKVS